MLNEGALVPRGIRDIGNLSERRPNTSRNCACASFHSARGLVSYMLKFADEETVTYLLALLPPHILGAPHQPRQDRQSTLEPDSRTSVEIERYVLLVLLFFATPKRAFLHPAAP